MEQINYDSSCIHDEMTKQSTKPVNKILIGAGILVAIALVIVLVVEGKSNRGKSEEKNQNKA